MYFKNIGCCVGYKRFHGTKPNRVLLRFDEVLFIDRSAKDAVVFGTLNNVEQPGITRSLPILTDILHTKRFGIN